jgi:predicted lipoprotein with Yx(FWY)xxD motif
MKTYSSKATGVTGALAAALLLAATVSGCSDNGGKSSSPSSSKSSKSAQGGAATVGLRSGKLGKFLVDDKGRTLYLFEADKSTKSTCFGGCAQAWPPFNTSGKPKAANGVKAGLLGTTKRKDGKTQVTYNGHPVYYYQGDSKAGDTNGEELDQFGAEWYVLDASGKKIEGKDY